MLARSWMVAAALLASGCNVVLGLDPREHLPADGDGGAPTADKTACNEAKHAFCDDFDGPRMRDLVASDLGSVRLDQPASSPPSALACSMKTMGIGEAMLHATIAQGPIRNPPTATMHFRLFLDGFEKTSSEGDVRIATMTFLEGKWSVHLVYTAASDATGTAGRGLAFRVDRAGTPPTYPSGGTAASIDRHVWNDITMEVETQTGDQRSLRLWIGANRLFDLPIESLGTPFDSVPTAIAVGMAVDSPKVDTSGSIVRIDDVTLDL